MSRVLSQEIPRILWNPTFTTTFTRARHLSLSWAISIQTTPHHTSRRSINTILPLTPRSSKWSLSLRSPQQNPVRTSASHTFHKTCPSHSWFDQLFTGYKKIIKKSLWVTSNGIQFTLSSVQISELVPAKKDDTEESDHLTSLVFFLSTEERRPNPSKCTTHTHTVVAMPDIIWKLRAFLEFQGGADEGCRQY